MLSSVNIATERPADQAATAATSPASAPHKKARIRLLLADDHPVVRLGVRSYFANHDRVEIVGEAVDGRDVLAKARELKPDVVFMDTFMPRMTGLAAAKLLGKRLPKTRVLMYSAHSDRECVLQIIRSGARGYVLKNAPPEELTQAIEEVNEGRIYYHSDVARLALDEYSRNLRQPNPHAISDLSERELEVLGKIAEGRSSREAANEFGISVRTVETHREHIMHKLQIHTVAGLVKFALLHGVVPMP
jgi:two-component system nitrate/nitrite response regulator NarL